MALFPA